MTSQIKPTLNWSLVKLNDVCEMNPRFLSKDCHDELLVSFLPMRSVEELSGKINLFEKKKLSEVKKGYTYFSNGDVIFAKITPCMENGKIAIVDNLVNGVGFGSTEFHVLRCSKRISNKYLFYYLVQTSFRKKAKDNMTGTAGQLRVPKKYLEETEIPLPPLPEQHKIVSKIEELFSELDKGIENLRKAKEQIKTYRQAVLAAAFSGKLTGEFRVENSELRIGNDDPLLVRQMLKAAEPKVEYTADKLPEGWKWVKLGEVIQSLQYGTSDKSNGEEDGIPVIRMGNIKDGILDFTKLKYFPRDYQDREKYTLEHEDILFNRTNSAELVGKSALYKQGYPESIFASYLIRIKINREMYSASFLNYYINSFYGREYIKSVVSQNVGQANVNGTKLRSMPVLLLSIKEQEEIVSEIERRFSVADKLEQTIDENLKKADLLKQSILKQAFEGKLV